MNTAIAYRALLTQAACALTVADDPDDLSMWEALLLAAHAGAHRQDGAGDDDWDLYTVAIIEAIHDLKADLDNPALLATNVPGPGPDSPELRRAVVDLVRRLADRYAAAAAGDSGSPWRRLVWAKVAHHLDDAAAELV